MNNSAFLQNFLCYKTNFLIYCLSKHLQNYKVELAYPVWNVLENLYGKLVRSIYLCHLIIVFIIPTVIAMCWMAPTHGTR